MTLTSASIKLQLQIANCCASEKGVEYQNRLKKGSRCPELLEDAELMVAYIDAIKGFIPSGEVVSGTQASVTVTIPLLAAPESTSILLGTSVYPATTIAAGAAADVATEIKDYINSFNPHSFEYTATSDGDQLTITGSSYDDNNTDLVSITSSTISISDSLSGGTEEVVRSEDDNAITNQQVESILERLCSLCDTPAEELLNFS